MGMFLFVPGRHAEWPLKDSGPLLTAALEEGGEDIGKEDGGRGVAMMHLTRSPASACNQALNQIIIGADWDHNARIAGSATEECARWIGATSVLQLNAQSVVNLRHCNNIPPKNTATNVDPCRIKNLVLQKGNIGC